MAFDEIGCFSIECSCLGLFTHYCLHIMAFII